MLGDGGAVVVAVGDAGTGQAVEWAAAEAAARGAQLRVVHAERLWWAVDPAGLVPAVDVCSSRLTAEDIVDAAVRRARDVAPEIEISRRVVFGPPVPLLVSQGRRAQLLVLGGGGTQARRRRALSVCRRIARWAPCPVAIVRPLPSGQPAGTLPRVVVGVGPSGARTAALEVAFRAAVQRALPVTVVHAWTPEPHTAEERVRGTLVGALEPWRRRFPDVAVETVLTDADPVPALVRHSQGAAMLVVGSRARAACAGSVGRSVAEQARCPVVVARGTTGGRGRATRDAGGVSRLLPARAVVGLLARIRVPAAFPDDTGGPHSG